MKFAVLVFCSIFTLAASGAPVENYALYPLGSEPNDNCSKWTSMTVDPIANTATLENRLDGVCDIFVAPNTRTYHLSLRSQTPEGARVHGLRRHMNGVDRLIILDYRSASVPVKFPGRVEVTELTTTGQSVLYTLPARSAR